jgi:hypothetical protein
MPTQINATKAAVQIGNRDRPALCGMEFNFRASPTNKLT